MFGKMLEQVRNSRPLIHCITNYVTANDCANILLACGGSPIMTDAEEEVEDIAALCGGLVINIGTLSYRSIPAMLKAGRKANELGHPVVLDPVGAGASRMRTETALRLIREIKFSVIRGNISEIKALALGRGTTKGVDADASDQLTGKNRDQIVGFIKQFARETGCVVSATGSVDIVTDSETAYCIRNGHPMMSRITGCGCQLSVLTAAYITANPGMVLKAAAAAVCTMGLCSEKACLRLGPDDGNASCRTYLIDAVCRLKPEGLDAGAKYEIL